MDPLSDVISLVRADSAVTGRLVASGAWAVHFKPPPQLKLYGVLKGGCHFRIDGQKRWLQANAGDVLMIGGERGYVMASDPEVAPRPAASLLVDAQGNARLNRGEATFECLAGRVELDAARGRVLLESLPSLLHLKSAQPALVALEGLSRELRSPMPGSPLVLRLQAQLLLVELLRASAPTTRGWLRLVADRALAPAMEAMHQNPGHAWTVAALARRCGLSRSSFAARFREHGAVAPLEYLTGWRMRLAQRSLEERDVGLGQLAAELGYESQSSFSVAFKRVLGMSPRAFKKQRLLVSP